MANFFPEELSITRTWKTCFWDAEKNSLAPPPACLAAFPASGKRTPMKIADTRKSQLEVIGKFLWKALDAPLQRSPPDGIDDTGDTDC
jgi:hypothetical protein